MKEEMEKMGGGGNRLNKMEMKDEMEKIGEEVEINWIRWK